MTETFVARFFEFLCERASATPVDECAVGYLDALIGSQEPSNPSMEYRKGYGWAKYNDLDFKAITEKIRAYANLT